ncbi:MAG: qbdA 1 [Conexibacter sp.]|nr:qbdA 1 [Conexibacter sp.]
MTAARRSRQAWLRSADDGKNTHVVAIDVEGRRITRRGLLAGGAALALGAAEARAARAARAGQRPRHGWEGRGRRGPGDWPMPAHDLAATRDGAPLDGSAERWRASFPGGVPATAAIADGRVYAASAQGAVAALALGDGRERWRRELGTAQYGSGDGLRQLGFFGGVAFARGSVIVASDRVFSLDARSGATRWVTTPLRTATSDDYFWGLPAIVGGLVLIGSGSGAELPTARGRLTAYRVADGALVWSTATVPEGANGGGLIGPASVDPRAGLVYVATGSPYQAVSGANPGTCSLLALRLRDGAVVWQDQVFPDDTHGFDFNSAPVIVGRRVFATNKAGIYAWDRIRRRRLWNRQLTDPLAGGATVAGPTGGPEGGPIATDGRRVYVLSNDAASGGCVAAALAPADGRVLWSTPLPAPSFGAPALAGRQLCVPAADGNLRLLDVERGTLVATVALGDPSSAAPALAHGRLVVGTGAAPFLPGSALVCIG